MPEINARIEHNFDTAPINNAMGESAAHRWNTGVSLTDFRQDPNISRLPDYWIHIYNISGRAFRVERPPYAPVINIPACPSGEPFKLALSIPNIFNEKTVSPDSGELVVKGLQGERCATDILNPINTSNDPWLEVNHPESIWLDNGGNDLTKRGCFWSKENPPSNADLARARERMERFYRNLLKEGNEMQHSGRSKDITPEHHIAAEHFGVTNAWHTSIIATTTCPQCGENIQPGIAFHKNSLGGACVLDWKKAVESGVKTLDDVPADKRWWAGKVPR